MAACCHSTSVAVGMSSADTPAARNSGSTNARLNVANVVAKFGGEVLAKLVPDVAYTTYIRTFILMC